jgi:hypothetical protein
VSVQPSDSPGVFSQYSASTSDGSCVLCVGNAPAPAPRALHQLAQSARMLSTPLRPVSISQCGSNCAPTLAFIAAVISATKLYSLLPPLHDVSRLHGSAQHVSLGLDAQYVLRFCTANELWIPVSQSSGHGAPSGW